MIVVDKKKCVGCGLCVRICHERCIVFMGENGTSVAEVNQNLCSTCTQCVAICSQQALSWNGVSPIAYDKSRLPTAEQLGELFKQRRTIRKFKQKKIGRALLEEIVGFGIYAPTNNYDLRAIVVDDPVIMEAFDVVIMKFVSLFYNLIYRSRAVFNLISAITPAINMKGKVKIAYGMQKGTAFDTLPAAIIFVVGDRRILLSEASAQYAMYNMMLYAQVKEIGSRIKAAGSMTLDRNRRVRRCLGLHKHEHILGTFELGYPAVRFRNKVEGKTMSIQWNGIEK